MSVNFSQKDWQLISAYLDGRLPAPEATQIEDRRKTSPEFDQAINEIEHTRKLLRALPAKRAPRNFTLSQQYAKSPSRKWGIHSAFGWASATTALALVTLFAWTNLFAARPMTSLKAPAAAPMAEMASDSAATSDSPPMIITWGQNNMAYGMGGGDGTMIGAKGDNGGYGGGGGAPEVGVMLEPVVENPQANPEEAASLENVDPSTLILGIPEPGTGGQIIERDTEVPTRHGPTLPVSTLWMIGLGAASLISAVLALILRRR